MFSTALRRWLTVGLLLLLAGGAILLNVQAAAQPPERIEGGTAIPAAKDATNTAPAHGSWIPRAEQQLGPAAEGGVTGPGIVAEIVSITCDDLELRRPIRISTGGASWTAPVVEVGAGWAIFAVPPKPGAKSGPRVTLLCQLLADGTLRVSDTSGSLSFVRN